MKKPKITIVIPTYNERKNIGKLIPRVFKVLNEHNIAGNVIVVDDNSPDNTAQEVKKLQKSYPIKLITRNKKMGLGSAYIVGFKEALKGGTGLTFEMDADLSHDPNEIPRFVEKIGEGYDVVVGSRLVQGGKVVGWGFWRKLVSLGGNLIGRGIAGVDISDLTSGYRVYKNEVLKTMNLDDVKSKSYDFQLEMLARAAKGGYNIGTIPIVFQDRAEGESKLSNKDIISFLLTAIKIRLKMI